MKLRKIFAAIAASAVIIGTSAAPCFAVGDGEATYCFDTADKLADWQTFGSVEETGFSITHTTRQSKNGEGCIVISENNPSEISEGYGGAYIEAASLGLPDFGSCTVTMSILVSEGAEDFCDNLAVFSDGIIWVQTAPENQNSTNWTEVSLIVPDGANNSRVGFTIPTLTPYSGDIVYIDDFTVTDSNGTVVANLGDYQVRTITEAETVSNGTNILLTILLVVLILVIVGGIGFIVSSAVKKFH